MAVCFYISVIHRCGDFIRWTSGSTRDEIDWKTNPPGTIGTSMCVCVSGGICIHRPRTVVSSIYDIANRLFLGHLKRASCRKCVYVFLTWRVVGVASFACRVDKIWWNWKTFVRFVGLPRFGEHTPRCNQWAEHAMIAGEHRDLLYINPSTTEWYRLAFVRAEFNLLEFCRMELCIYKWSIEDNKPKTYYFTLHFWPDILFKKMVLFIKA